MKRWIFAFFTVLLIAALMVAPTAAQTDAPPQVQAALVLLSQYLGHAVSLADMDRWGFSQAFYPDTSLGCSLITTPTSLASPVSGYTIQLVYEGVPYEFRVREDLRDAFPCDSKLMQFATPGAISATVVSATEAAPSNCPPGYTGYLPPRLVVGGQGRIGESGTANRLRARPALSAEQIGLIQPGTTVDVLDGPSCEDATKIIWWRVNDNGTIGWTAEGLNGNYFLDPVAGGPLDLPQERSIIDAETFSAVTTLATVAFPNATSVAFSDNGLVAIGGQQGLLIYDLATLQQLDLNINIQPNVALVAFSPDSHYLAFTTQDDQLFVVDTTTGVTITPANPPPTKIDALAFSASNLLAVGGVGVTGDPFKAPAWYMYDIPNQRQLAVHPTDSSVTAVAFSPDGSMFAWTDRALNVISVADGASLLSQPIATPAPGGLAWRPNLPAGTPNQIAYADGAHVLMLTLGGQGQSYGDAPAFFPGVIRFSPDGSIVAAMNLQAAGSTTPTVVNAFDVESGDVLYGTGFEIGRDFDFSPDSTLIVLVQADSVVFLGVDTASLAVG